MTSTLRSLSLVVFVMLSLWSCGGRGAHRGASTEQHSVAEKATGELFVLSPERFAAGSATDTLFMGRMGDGEVVSRMVTLRNDGSSPLLFVRTSTSCGCVSVDLPTEPLAAGAEVVVPFRFDSAGYGGTHVVRPIYIYTSLSDHPLMVVVTAEVR